MNTQVGTGREFEPWSWGPKFDCLLGWDQMTVLKTIYEIRRPLPTIGSHRGLFSR